MTELIWWVLFALGLRDHGTGFEVDEKVVKEFKEKWEKEHET